ncbi:acetylornithine transaminase, partial [Baffinella frigidus]
MGASNSMAAFGSIAPRLRTVVPGPASIAAVDRLARHECPAITLRRDRRAKSLGAERQDPIVWRDAQGSNVRDVDGNVFVDMMSGFGVAVLGHRHPAVVAAVRDQQDHLLHAMGDVYPDATRIDLLEQLAAIAPGDLSVSILGLSGADSIDAAVKTAVLSTGRTGVLTFEGSYHGLALGVVALQGYKPEFTEPFAKIAHPDVRRLPYGAPADVIRAAMAAQDVGLVLVEPFLGRGGIVEPPAGWLQDLAEVTREAGAVLAFDEIACGLGASGELFASERDGVVPDLLCIGKSLGGGFPLSACIGTPAVMAAWAASKGEAIHTQTFLGHPVACAAALAVIEQIRGKEHCDRVRERGEALVKAFGPRAHRGRGLIRAVEIKVDAIGAMRHLLELGFIVLPAGQHSIG